MPRIKSKDKPLKDQIGLKLMQNNGQEAEVLEYLGNNRLLVRFPDGKTRTCSSCAFRHGEVAHPDHMKFMGKPEEREGLRAITRDGLEIELTTYHSALDIEVTFLIDNTVVKASYTQFKRANISHPTIKSVHNLSFQEFAIGYYLYRLGFVKIPQGQWSQKGFGQFELDFYNEQAGIAIEYDGSIHAKPDTVTRDIRKNEKCKEFGIMLYRLREHTLPILTDGNSINYILPKENNITRYLNSCKAELEEILSKHAIVVDEDFINFARDKNDIIQQYQQTTINYYRNIRVGDMKYSEKHQQMLKIIDYRAYDDIDVEFMLDNQILYNTIYQKYVNDKLPHPTTARKNLKANRLGKTFPQKNGHVCKIIKYDDCDHITIEWEDGTVRENIPFASIKKGIVGYTPSKNHANND